MRILHVTAGAANMYCGSCMRDNALAAELKRQGHDVVLMPVYTPTLTDEENVSETQVFFGGISVYLQQKTAFFRYTPKFVDRLLFDNNWALRKASQQSIGVDPKFLGEMTIDMLLGEKGPLGKEFRKLTDWLQREPKFDVITLPFTLLIALAEPMARVTGTRVICTLQGEDLFLDGLPPDYKAAALRLIRLCDRYVDRYVAVSRYYADHMAGYLGISPSKIRVAPLGINLSGYSAKPKPPRDIFKIGFFARIDPAKGLHHLCEGYRILRQRKHIPPTQIDAAGYLLPEHKPYLAEIESSFETFGLAGEFTYHGALPRDEKIRFLQDIDLLCVPTEYAEPKGLFALEAMACGTPLVLPAHGAFPEILFQTGGGLLVEPRDPVALADSLEEMICDPERRQELAARGAENVRQFYSVNAMAHAVLAAYA